MLAGSNMDTTTRKTVLVLTALCAVVRAQVAQPATSWPGYPPAASYQQQGPYAPQVPQQQGPYAPQQQGPYAPQVPQQQQVYPQPQPGAAYSNQAPPSPSSMPAGYSPPFIPTPQSQQPQQQQTPPVAAAAAAPLPQQPASPQQQQAQQPSAAAPPRQLQLEPMGSASAPDGSHAGVQLFRGDDAKLYEVDWSYPRFRMLPNSILLKKFGGEPPEYVAMYRLRAPAQASADSSLPRHYGAEPQRWQYDPMELIPGGAADHYVSRTL